MTVLPFQLYCNLVFHLLRKSAKTSRLHANEKYARTSFCITCTCSDDIIRQSYEEVYFV